MWHGSVTCAEAPPQTLNQFLIISDTHYNINAMECPLLRWGSDSVSSAGLKFLLPLPQSDAPASEWCWHREGVPPCLAGNSFYIVSLLGWWKGCRLNIFHLCLVESRKVLWTLIFFLSFCTGRNGLWFWSLPVLALGFFLDNGYFCYRKINITFWKQEQN